MMKQVLLYSKYSSHCKKLMGAMSQYGTNIPTVCIDNPQIREKVAEDSRLRIKVVPTLLTIYPSGIVEKYEGERVMQLLIEKYETKPTIQRVVPEFRENLPPKPSKSEKVKKSKKKKGIKSRTKIVDLDSDTGEDETSSSDESGPQLGDLLKIETPGKLNERKELGENLPIRKSSGVATMVAEMQKQRDAFDSSRPKPTQNNIRPYK